jgi:DNA-binding response OmpR family regulator
MPRILIVTDDRVDRGRTHAALSIAGNELFDHDDPATAAQRAADERADVAVVDLQVGSMGGMAVARDFRARSKRIPVVLLLDRQADTFLAGRSGADAWVIKPIEASTLRAAIAEAVEEEVA